MRVTSLGSGSNGNSFVVQSGATCLLVDAGIPIRTLRSSLVSLALTAGSFSAVLISHEHSDHVRALPQVVRDATCTFFATEGTIASVARTCGQCDWERLRADVSIRIESISVTPIQVSHDASEPVGFVFEDGCDRVAIITDLGETNRDVGNAISEANLIVLESNYDEIMLAQGRYPAHLKRRIRGPQGHLSNADCAAFLAENLSSRATDVWLAHLSENNNRPAVALTTALATVGHGPHAPSVRPLPRYGHSHGRVVTWDGDVVRTTPRQVSLF